MRRNDLRRWLPVVAIATLAGCSSRPAEESSSGPSPYAADWVAQQIAAFESGAEASRVIGKVVHDGAPLYLIDSPCCDLFNFLYTAEGKVFCAPSGGFAGHGDGKCPPGIGPISREGREAPR